VVFAGVRDPAKADRLQSLSKQHQGRIHIVKLTSGDIDDNKAAAATIAREVGHLDVVIANAGIAKHIGRVEDTPIKEMIDHYHVNTIGPLVLFQSTASLLKQSPSQPKFIVISSVVGSITLTDQVRMQATAYGASKAAVNYITRKIHFENEHLCAFVIHPGFAQTDMGNTAAKTMGMEEAPLKIEDCVKGMVKIVDTATRETHGGKFPRADQPDEPIVPW